MELGGFFLYTPVSPFISLFLFFILNVAIANLLGLFVSPCTGAQGQGSGGFLLSVRLSALPYIP